MKNSFRVCAPVTRSAEPILSECGEQTINGIAFYEGKNYEVTAHVVVMEKIDTYHI